MPQFNACSALAFWLQQVDFGAHALAVVGLIILPGLVFVVWHKCGLCAFFVQLACCL